MTDFNPVTALDLRAVCRSGGMFSGLVAAPLAAGLSDCGWTWCVLAAAGTAVAGFTVATTVGRVVFPAPSGQAVVARAGPAAPASRCGHHWRVASSSLCRLPSPHYSARALSRRQ